MQLKEKTQWRKSIPWLATIAGMLLITGCGTQITVLNPQGPVAASEYHLIVRSFWLMMIVVVPVLILFVYVLVRFRARPGLSFKGSVQEGNRFLEVAWTIIPLAIIAILAVPTVRTTFALEHPPQTVTSRSPLTIDVTALQWKWVFQYPAQGIETVNYAVIPTGVPVRFLLTADGPMSSFWVPALGGQEMAMPGRHLRLWLEATHPGVYLGRNSNFSGRGFAFMTFHVMAETRVKFDRWIHHVMTSAPPMTNADFNHIWSPGRVPTLTFSSYVS